MGNKKQLMEIYQQRPCRTLPNALWKMNTLGEEDLRIDIERGRDHRLTSLAVWQEYRLMALWCEGIQHCPLSSEQVADVPFALVHSSALPIFENRQFSHQEAFFRFIHIGNPPVYHCPPGFVYRDVDPQKEDVEHEYLNAVTLVQIAQCPLIEDLCKKIDKC